MAIVEDIPPSVPRCVGGKCGSRATEYFLGLPMVYNQNSKLTLISKCQTTVYRNILPVYGTFDEKSGEIDKIGYTRVVSEQTRVPFFSRRGVLTRVCKTPPKRVLAPEPTTPCVRAAPQTVFSVFDRSKQRQ